MLVNSELLLFFLVKTLHINDQCFHHKKPEQSKSIDWFLYDGNIGLF